MTSRPDENDSDREPSEQGDAKPSAPLPRAPERSRVAAFVERWTGRPTAVLVFAASFALLAYVELGAYRSVTAEGVGWSPTVEYAVPASGVVAELHVREGERVQVGDLLVTVEALPLRQDLERVDAEIRRTIREGRFEQARLAAERDRESWERMERLSRARARAAETRAEAQRHAALMGHTEGSAGSVREAAGQRLVTGAELRSVQSELFEHEARAREASALVRSELTTLRELRESLPDDEAHGLERSLVELWESELELLRVQREGIEEQLASLVVRAGAQGRVVTLVSVGSPVAPNTPLARIVPERAEEVVAYLAPEIDPSSVPVGAQLVAVRAAGVACVGRLPTRVGAEVALAPGQLSTAVLGRPMYGLPVRVELPPDCMVGVGQHVSLSFGMR